MARYDPRVWKFAEFIAHLWVTGGREWRALSAFHLDITSCPPERPTQRANPKVPHKARKRKASPTRGLKFPPLP